MAVPAGALAIAGSPVGIGNAEPGLLVGGNILLRVRAANGRDDVFLQRRIDSFRGLIDNFCWLWGGVVGLVRFSFKGEPLDADNDTPEKLEMREHDVICESSLLQNERCDRGFSFCADKVRVVTFRAPCSCQRSRAFCRYSLILMASLA